MTTDLLMCVAVQDMTTSIHIVNSASLMIALLILFYSQCTHKFCDDIYFCCTVYLELLYFQCHSCVIYRIVV